VIRSLATMLHVLSLLAPDFGPKHEAAVLLNELGAQHGFDPATLAVMVAKESKWHPGAIGKGGAYIGLAQIRLANFRDDRREQLLNWRYNLTTAASYIEFWREHCRETVGSSLAVYWLQGWQGFDAVNHTTCGHRMVRGKWRPVAVPERVKRTLELRKEVLA
jgi:hypothetical protein